MAKIRYSKSAIRDLEEIGDYIAETLKSPVAALNTVNKIQDAVDMLICFPQIGSPLSSIVSVETDYRFLVSGNYLVFYRERKEVINIDRVIYGRRDYMAILFGDLSDDETEPSD